MNLKFNTGQRPAVVGMNGSGKITMVKLLCRLCDPTEGEFVQTGGHDALLADEGGKYRAPQMAQAQHYRDNEA